MHTKGHSGSRRLKLSHVRLSPLFLQIWCIVIFNLLDSSAGLAIISTERLAYRTFQYIDRIESFKLLTRGRMKSLLQVLVDESVVVSQLVIVILVTFGDIAWAGEHNLKQTPYRQDEKE